MDDSTRGRAKALFCILRLIPKIAPASDELISWMEKIFFDGWSPVGRTLITGAFAYIALIFFLRVCGKRTLSKWNAFDYIVTIALGSTLATMLLSKDHQPRPGCGRAPSSWSVCNLSSPGSRFASGAVSGLVKAKPVLLLRKGKMQDEAMCRARVDGGRNPRRAAQPADSRPWAQAAAVVLETDGSFSVIRELDDERRFDPVRCCGFPESRRRLTRGPADWRPRGKQAKEAYANDRWHTLLFPSF